MWFDPFLDDNERVKTFVNTAIPFIRTLIAAQDNGVGSIMKVDSKLVTFIKSKWSDTVNDNGAYISDTVCATGSAMLSGNGTLCACSDAYLAENTGTSNEQHLHDALLTAHAADPSIVVDPKCIFAACNSNSAFKFVDDPSNSTTCTAICLVYNKISVAENANSSANIVNNVNCNGNKITVGTPCDKSKCKAAGDTGAVCSLHKDVDNFVCDCSNSSQFSGALCAPSCSSDSSCNHDGQSNWVCNSSNGRCECADGHSGTGCAPTGAVSDPTDTASFASTPAGIAVISAVSLVVAVGIAFLVYFLIRRRRHKTL
jgi:hypothetical protein